MPKGIIILQSGCPSIIPICNSLLLLGITNVWYDTPGLRIRMNDRLSNKHHVLSPKNRGCWSRKGHSVEKTAIFVVFHKVLIDRWLHGYLSVNGRFTKYEFAKGKVSLRQRLCFVVWKVMFEAMKHGLWSGQSLCLAMRKLSFHKMRNDRWRMKSRFLHILTSLSPLFPDKFLSRLLTSE